MNSSPEFLITCEHGGKRVPAGYQHFFRGHKALLHSHRGYDAGALTMARELASALHAPLRVSTISRLVVDLNRSIGHPRLHCDTIREAPPAVRNEILEKHYLPYRTQAETDIAQAVARSSRVIHIASHSFTPELHGAVRNADIGLLYDPARAEETRLCERWQAWLKREAPHLTVRRNYPYRGTSDGFTVYLRRRFPGEVYVGLELEINQKHILPGGRRWQALRALLIEALQQAVAG